MRIIKEKTLAEYGRRHPDARSALKEWVREVRAADWETSAEAVERFPNARRLKDNRLVFNIKGNDYRLVVHVFYPAKVVSIKWFGTHAEYDEIDPVVVNKH